jgi:hypothetical protein
MAQTVGFISRIGALTIAMAFCSCGGRTQLIPAYQIGRLSSDAVVANDAGVRVVVRTAAWPGPPLDFMNIIPLEMTLDNGSTYGLQIDRQYITLVGENGQPVAPWEPPDSQPKDATLDSMTTRALPERVLAPNARMTGFVYFLEPPDGEQLELRIDLVDGATDTRFGRIEIPFSFE